MKRLTAIVALITVWLTGCSTAPAMRESTVIDSAVAVAPVVESCGAFSPAADDLLVLPLLRVGRLEADAASRRGLIQALGPMSHDLAKAVWTNQDFEVMGWHDSHLYCFTVLPEQFELALDIDYIAKWVKPVPPDEYFRFWVAPATLIFQDVQNINVSIEMGPLVELEILEITRSPVEGKEGDWHWHIDLTTGEISFDATAYTQYFRQEPSFTPAQSLGIDARGGASFAKVAYGA